MKISSLKYFLKKLLLFLSPVILLVALYFICDPFFVLRNYSSYERSFLKTYIRNRISTQQFLNYNPKYQFKSYVFGSSRSGGFTTKDYGRFVNDPNPFHFSAFSETIEPLLDKMNFISDQGNKIENALFVIDDITFSNHMDNMDLLIRKKDYKWRGGNYLKYQFHFFKSFFKNQYFISYFDANITHKYKSYMGNNFDFDYLFETPFNDFTFIGSIDEIKRDSIGYYQNNFFKRKDVEEQLEPVIDLKDIMVLFKMKEIFDKNKTNLKIIVAPNFNFRKINNRDLYIVKKIFGENILYDYSGKNMISSDIHNFYESSHFKTYIGNQILKEVFISKNQ